jgi:glutamine synthetase
MILHPTTLPADLAGATRSDVLRLAEEHNVRFLRLQFTDILGVNKNVELPRSQFEKALGRRHHVRRVEHRGVRADRGERHAARPRPRDLPDLPWGDPGARVARLICDITAPDGTPFDGDPRAALKRQLARAREMGFSTMNAGMEAEFFMFKRGPNGEATTETHDVAPTSTSPRWTSARRPGARSWTCSS